MVDVYDLREHRMIYSELMPGDFLLVTDHSISCLDRGSIRTVHLRDDDFYVRCTGCYKGWHDLGDLVIDWESGEMRGVTKLGPSCSTHGRSGPSPRPRDLYCA